MLYRKHAFTENHAREVRSRGAVAAESKFRVFLKLREKFAWFADLELEVMGMHIRRVRVARQRMRTTSEVKPVASNPGDAFIFMRLTARTESFRNSR